MLSYLAAVVEASSDAIIGKTLDGTILSWNPAAERIYGYSAAEMIGQSITLLVPDDRMAEQKRIVAAIARGERLPAFATVRRAKDGTLIPLSISISPVHDASGLVAGASEIARELVDVTELKARLIESETRFQVLADNIPPLAWMADGEGSIYWYNKRWFDYTGTTLEEMKGWGWQAVHHPDHVDRVVAKIKHCFETGEFWEDTFPLRRADGQYRWFLSRARPVRDATGGITNWFGTNTDITEQRLAEERNELLLLEVNHRSKNLMALIQAIARGTASSDPAYVDCLQRRIAGLAASQDLIVRRSWTSVPILELVDVQLSFLGPGRDRVSVAGPQIDLTARSAEPISMAIHELATNALKYGALSQQDGRVEIAWSLTGGEDGGDRRFHMSWIETGGPEVCPPEKNGFGSRIICDNPRAKLSADVRMDYRPEGARWVLDCPADGAVAGD